MGGLRASMQTPMVGDGFQHYTVHFPTLGVRGRRHARCRPHAAMVLLGELVQHALDTAGARQWTPSGVKGAGMELKRERLVC